MYRVMLYIVANGVESAAVESAAAESAAAFECDGYGFESLLAGYL